MSMVVNLSQVWIIWVNCYKNSRCTNDLQNNQNKWGGDGQCSERSQKRQIEYDRKIHFLHRMTDTDCSVWYNHHNDTPEIKRDSDFSNFPLYLGRPSRLCYITIPSIQQGETYVSVFIWEIICMHDGWWELVIHITCTLEWILLAFFRRKLAMGVSKTWKTLEWLERCSNFLEFPGTLLF